METNTHPAELKQQIEKDLNALLIPHDMRMEAFNTACRHAIMVGGKRVRPLFTHLFFEACHGKDTLSARNAALAIELLHSYTLVHDDLPAMDNDTERRGHPTVWAKYGECNAILVGDWLQAKAFSLLAETQHAAPLLTLLGQAATDVIHGQVADIDATHEIADKWDEALLDYIFRYKTAALIATACEMGVVAADGSEEARQVARNFGQKVGLAFQYVDDLLDAEQGSVGNEFSALRILSREAILRRVDDLTSNAIAGLAKLPGPTEPLVAFADALRSRIL